MRNMLCILLFSCIALSIALADTIYMKNGLKIDGEILTVAADSVTIRTASGVLTIAAADIERIETAQVLPEKREINEGAIPKSIMMVGYGCLGGVIGGSVAGLGAVWTDAYGDPYLFGTIMFGSVIAGVLIGVAVGAK